MKTSLFRDKLIKEELKGSGKEREMLSKFYASAWSYSFIMYMIFGYVEILFLKEKLGEQKF